MSRFGGVQEYRRYVQSEIEEEIDDFYKGSYQMPILGDKGFVQRVREMLTVNLFSFFSFHLKQGDARKS
jgi:hypothetical protein